MKEIFSEFKEFDKSLKQDPLSYLCLAAIVVISWSLPQMVIGSNNLFTNSYFLLN